MALIPQSLTINIKIMADKAAEAVKGLQGRVHDLMGGVQKFAEKVNSKIGGTLNFTASAITKSIGGAVAYSGLQMLKLDNELKKAQFRYASITGQVKEFESALITTATKSNIAADALFELTTDLLEAGFKASSTAENIIDVAAETYKFSHVTGVATAAVNEITAEMSKFNASSIPMLETLGRTRTIFHLNTNEMTVLTKATSNAIINFKAFGGSLRTLTDAEVKRATASIAALGGALMQAGGEASQVADIIASMTDPGKFMDNIDRMALLGVSVDDLTTSLRDGIMNAEGPLRKMAEYGGMIAQNPFLGAEFAKRIGVSSTVLMRIHDNLGDYLARARDVQQLNATTTELWDKMGGSIEKIHRAWIRLVNSLITVLSPALQKIAPVLEAGAETVANWAKNLSELDEKSREFLGFGLLIGAGLMLTPILVKAGAALLRLFGAETAGVVAAKKVNEQLKIQNTLLTEKAIKAANASKAMGGFVATEGAAANTAAAVNAKQASGGGMFAGRAGAKTMMGVGAVSLLGGAFNMSQAKSPTEQTIAGVSSMIPMIAMMFTSSVPLLAIITIISLLIPMVSKLLPRFFNFEKEKPIVKETAPQRAVLNLSALGGNAAAARDLHLTGKFKEIAENTKQTATETKIANEKNEKLIQQGKESQNSQRSDFPRAIGEAVTNSIRSALGQNQDLTVSSEFKPFTE